MNIVVTGAMGFIGRNLITRLAEWDNVSVIGIDIDSSEEKLDISLANADYVVHLAGINRPDNEEEFTIGNVDLTAKICDKLLQFHRAAPLIFSSSTQAELDNPYGISKRRAEDIVKEYAHESGAQVFIFRLTNVFGKWCRPNYNSVVATFCHNIARDLPVEISDPEKEIDFLHVDDVVSAFLTEIMDQESGAKEVGVSLVNYLEVIPSFRVSLGDLANLIHSFRASRQSLIVPRLDDAFVHKLYGTYLSYLEEENLAYDLEQHCDARGCLAEFVKSKSFGQIFVSRTKPGITRGDHYHHIKAERFLVLEGEAIIRFRRIDTDQVIEYRVQGEDFRVLDIPVGYTHSIENVGSGDLVTLFWASEIFNPARADTVYLKV